VTLVCSPNSVSGRVCDEWVPIPLDRLDKRSPFPLGGIDWVTAVPGFEKLPILPRHNSPARVGPIHVEIDAGDVTSNLGSRLNTLIRDLDIAGAESPLLAFEHAHFEVLPMSVHLSDCGLKVVEVGFHSPVLHRHLTGTITAFETATVLIETITMPLTPGCEPVTKRMGGHHVLDLGAPSALIRLQGNITATLVKHFPVCESAVAIKCPWLFTGQSIDVFLCSGEGINGLISVHRTAVRVLHRSGASDANNP
jgi:hypothetical protein